MSAVSTAAACFFLGVITKRIEAYVRAVVDKYDGCADEC